MIQVYSPRIETNKVSKVSLQIHRFAYKEDKFILSPTGPPSNLTRWYPHGIPNFLEFLFVSGSGDGLLLVDEGGSYRFYSWMTNTFGYAHFYALNWV
jgi:hypothetical protein